MYLKTHLVATVFGILVFLSLVEHKLIFVLVALIATFIPDVDSKNSKLGKKKIFRPFQFFIKHRGFVHSFTFLITISVILFFIMPEISYGFALGFGLHLIFDALTIQGIKPFWPSRYRIKGRFKTGRGFEIFIFLVLIILDIFLFLHKILKVF